MTKDSAQSGEPDHDFAPPSPPSNTDYRHARWPTFSNFPPRTRSAAPRTRPLERRPPSARKTPPEVVVVGVCSSGKSTLVRKLREAGYDAQAVAQEHSYVPHLWQRLNPRVLVYLDASLPTIRQRRRAKWPRAMLDEEHRRLAHAREHCDLYIPTDGLLPEDVASRVATFLHSRANSEDEQGQRSA